MTGPVLVLVEHDRGVPAETAYQAFALASTMAEGLGSTPVEAVLIGNDAAPLAAAVTARGAQAVRLVHHADLDDYAPEAWGDALAAAARATGAQAVVAVGTDRGNEVLAHVAAVEDLPFAANVTAVEITDGACSLTRVRWGGSLLEQASLEAPVLILSAAAHAFAAPEPDASSPTPAIEELTP